MIKDGSHLCIWDYPDTKPKDLPSCKLILWRSSSENENNYISIPSLTEKWSDSIKSDYLDWIYKLGKFEINGETIIDILKIRDKFSAWWFGLIVEKSNFSKSLYINDVVRLLTFRKLISNKKVLKITLYSSNSSLKNALKNFCLKNKILFESVILMKRNKNYQFSIKKLFFSSSYFLRAIIWFIYKVAVNIPLINLSVNDLKIKKTEYVFLSYLFNMKDSDTNNFLYSSYWGNLPKKLKDDKKFSTWIHIYVKDKILKTPNAASKLIQKLNHNNINQNHITLFSFFSKNVFFKVISDWLLLLYKINKINFNKKSFPRYKDLYLWDFYKDDWYDSFIGNNAIDNLLYLALFEEAFKLCDKKPSVTYLLENQGWEISMLSASKAQKIYKSIGFSHANSRYWDLRNFYDSREYSNNSKLNLPRPSILAVNSNIVLKQFLNYGYPKEEIKLVEALRHLYLKKNYNFNHINKKKTLLVLGDYENANVEYQLSMLNTLPKNLINNLNIIFKPHPASRINTKYFASLEMEVRNENLSELLPLANIAYCGSLTSASIDAFSFGLEVIVLIDTNLLNLSPLRNFEDVSFVMNKSQLEIAMVKLLSGTRNSVNKRCIFELNNDLPLWRKLLYETL